MIRNRLFAVAAVLTAGVFAWNGIARAGEEVPSAPVASKAAPTTTEAVTKTPSPIHSMLGWVGKQVAPELACGCPAKAEGEKAYRAWFAAGKDAPLADLRDRLVADGWTADRFVTHFKEMAAKNAVKGGSCDGAPCGDKAKASGCCEDKSEARADGKPCCGGCKSKKADEAATPPTTPAKPEETSKP
jgi:hypothetical protein